MKDVGAHGQSAMASFASSNTRYAARSQKKGMTHDSDFTQEERTSAMSGDGS